MEKVCLEELPSVLWAIQTIEKTSHGHTLYSLTYGSEAVIPAEIGIPTYRTKNVSEEANDVELMVNLTLADEWRNMASINQARYKKKRRATTVKGYDQSHSALAIWSSTATTQVDKKTRAS
jgi:hypothetical protein